MQEVRRTITIELEVDLVGTFIPGEAATHNNTANEPMIVDLHVVGIRGERQSRTYKGLSSTVDILDGVCISVTQTGILENIAYLCEPEVEPIMIDDAIRGEG